MSLLLKLTGGAPGSINITGASTLDPVTASSSVTLPIAITSASTIGAVAASSEVDVVIAISGANTLGVVASSSAVSVGIAITGANTIGLIAANSSVALPIAISGASQIGDLSQSSSVTLGTAAINITGSSQIGVIGQSSSVSVSGAAVVEVNWPGISIKERQRAALVASLVQQAKERGREWIEANKPQVKRNIRRKIERELDAQGLLTTSIMGEVAPMLSDALESLPTLDFDAMQSQLAQFDNLIWQRAERLAEEYRQAMILDDEEAMILLLAA